MSKLFKIFLFNILMSSFLFGNIIVSDDAEWDVDEKYLDITIDDNDICGSLKKYENDPDNIIVDEIRWYYLFDSKTNEKIGTYKLFKNKCLNTDTDEVVDVE